MTRETFKTNKAEGIRGTIQNFFLPYSNYSITILMDKLNIFLEINFLNFLVVFPALFNLFLEPCRKLLKVGLILMTLKVFFLKFTVFLGYFI
jgi:hypothetical protein